jgi:hypothetical protein
MQGGVAVRIQPLLECDWSGAETVVDVGGGNGSLLRALLSAQPHLRGVLFDQPHVVAAATPGERCTAVGGSFFEAVPEGDVHVQMQILHDWNDEDATRILRVCRAAVPGHGRLRIVDLVVPDEISDEPSTLIDLQMLVLLGGRERTLTQWRDLLAAGGFELAGVTTGPRSSVLEALPA